MNAPGVRKEKGMMDLIGNYRPHECIEEQLCVCAGL